MKTYEIIHADTNEILVDNLSFEDMAEQIKVYFEFYGEDKVVGCVRNIISRKCTPISTPRAYKNAWIDFFAELQEMGNLEWS